MDRVTLSALIERYTVAHELNRHDFAVAGDGAKFLLNDSDSFTGPIELAFRKTFTRELPTTFEGHVFCVYRDHAKWASYNPSIHSDKFVITTRHRLDARRT